jgi:hypothetical protein
MLTGLEVLPEPHLRHKNLHIPVGLPEKAPL